MSIEDALRAAGWNPHNGGPCPVHEDSYPVVLLAGGEMDCERASDQLWEPDPRYPYDTVIAWKTP